MADEARGNIEAALRPALPDALAAWRALVRADSDQVERLPNRPRPEDFYGPIAEIFRADPRRSDDPLLEQLRALVLPDETWIDVGAGGGRYSLAIALLAKRLYAVEPSEGMLAVLASGLAEHGIANVEIFAERWPGPSAAPVADVGFISQVGYDIEDIGPFLDQLEAHARLLCVAVLFAQAPISDFAPLWQPVHGEPRALLPGLGEFVTLLFARGRVPELRLVDLPPRTFADMEAMHAAVRRPLWVLPDTPEDARLAGAVREQAVTVAGGVALSARPRQLGIVKWRPRD